MDPSPSLPASIDTLLAGITSTSLTITNFIRAVRSARPDLAAVTRELADLCLVLELLRDDHVVPTRMQPRVRDVLTCCSVILQRVTSLAAAATDSGRGDRGDAARVRWSDKEKAEMVQLWIALQTYREALGLIDEVAHLWVHFFQIPALCFLSRGMDIFLLKTASSAAFGPRLTPCRAVSCVY